MGLRPFLTFALSSAGSAPEVGRSGRLAGIGRRVSISLLVVLAWIALLLLFVAFWAGPFTEFQKLVIFLASLLAVLGLLIVLWTVPRAGGLARPEADRIIRWPFMDSVQGFLGFTIVVLFAIILLLAMMFGVFFSTTTAEKTTSAVMQIASAVLLAVIGFYFGSSREVEKEAEKRKEAEKDAEKAKGAAEQFGVDQKAGELLHQAEAARNRGDWVKSREKYEEALKLDASDALRSSVRYEYVWHLLASENPEYSRILQLVEEVLPLYEKLPYDTDYNETYLNIVKAVALAHQGQAVQAVDVINQLDDDSRPWEILKVEGSLEPAKHLLPLVSEAILEKISRPGIKKYLQEELKSIGGQG